MVTIINYVTIAVGISILLFCLFTATYLIMTYKEGDPKGP